MTRSHYSSRKLLLLGAAILFGTLPALSQEDEDFEDFDPSQFEEAGEVLQAFCTNKVLMQSPSPLLSLGFDYQGPATLTAPAVGAFGEETAEWQAATGFRFVSNVPILSRNNLLINWGVSYVQMGYQPANDAAFANPLAANLSNFDLKWLNTSLTVFKPLNEKRFLLLQAGIEFNGDYNFSNLPQLSNARFPIALMYGWKPSDNFMWALGASRTYLGGALNYLPIIYYYQTFKNDRWGIEALLPARLQARYRINSRNVLLAGYNVEGATYRLSNFNLTPNTEVINPENNVELRRSEIRLGLSYMVGLNDFIWLGAQAGYRLNYAYDVDQGDFYRGFSDDGFFMQPGLTNSPFAQITISMVSP